MAPGTCIHEGILCNRETVIVSHSLSFSSYLRSATCEHEQYRELLHWCSRQDSKLESKFALPFSSSSIKNVVGRKVTTVDACAIAIAIIVLYRSIVLYQTNAFPNQYDYRAGEYHDNIEMLVNCPTLFRTCCHSL